MASQSPALRRTRTRRSRINAASTIAATENRMPNAVAESTPEPANARPMTVAMPYARAPTAARATPTTPMRSCGGASIDDLRDGVDETLAFVMARCDDSERVGSHTVRRTKDANPDAVLTKYLGHLMRPFAECVLEVHFLVGVQVETGDTGEYFGQPGVVGEHLHPAAVGPVEVAHRSARHAHVDPGKAPVLLLTEKTCKRLRFGAPRDAGAGRRDAVELRR